MKKQAKEEIHKISFGTHTKRKYIVDLQFHNNTQHNSISIAEKPEYVFDK